jgi:hypothetical protein
MRLAGDLEHPLVPNGNCSPQAIADARKGPNGFSTPLTITVDNPVPTTSVVLPENETAVSGQFYLDAVASSGVTRVNFLFCGGPENWSPRTMNGTLQWIYAGGVI